MEPIVTEKQAVVIRHSSGKYIKIQSDPNPSYFYWESVKRTSAPYDFKKVDVAASRLAAVRAEAQKVVDQHTALKSVPDQNNTWYRHEVEKCNWWLTNDFEIIECKIITIIEPKELP